MTARAKKGTLQSPNLELPSNFPSNLLSDVRSFIETARGRAAVAVNAELSGLYWQIGTRINQEVLQDARADYGQQVVQGLAHDLSRAYGTGWSVQQLRHCLQFAKVFPDQNIVSALRRQLNWTQIKTLIYLQDELKRTFYLEMAQLERWSSRQFQRVFDTKWFYSRGSQTTFGNREYR